MSAAIVSSFHQDFRDFYKGFQSHRATTDFRQQVSAIERQLVNSYAASSLLVSGQVPTLTSSTPVKSPTKQHAPLTSSNSVANCNAASHLKSISAHREHRKLDRSVSEPADRSQVTLRPTPQNSSRYKTELCRPFEENGTCKYGDKCQFAHGQHELRTLTRHPKYKTELCRTFHTTGFCPYGPRCHFIHNSEDSKKCLLNTLQHNGGPTSSVSMSPPKLLAPKDLEICSFSLGSTGELSPTCTSSGSGSPTSSLGGFFLDDGHYSLPLTAPPLVSPGFYFPTDYNSTSLTKQDYPQQNFENFEPDDTVVSSISMMVSNLNCSDGDDSKTEKHVKTDQTTTALDINRNVIRLPIFSRLAHSTTS